MVGFVTDAITVASATVNVQSTAGMEVGMVIDNTGYSAIDGVRTIASIVDNNTITLDSTITIDEDVSFTATKIVDDIRIVKVTLDNPVTLTAGTTLEFVRETASTETRVDGEKTITAFDIPKGDITANANNISFVVQDATSITTDATITDLATFQTIRLNHIGKYSDMNTVRDYNTGNKTIKIDGLKVNLGFSLNQMPETCPESILT